LRRTRDCGATPAEIWQDVDLTGRIDAAGWYAGSWLAAHASGAPSAEAPTVEALIKALDPEVRAAIAVPSEPPKVDD
jgi:hypothetical protein